MGKQVTFIMYGSDEETFLLAARKLGMLHILKDTSSSESFECFDELPPSSEPGWFQVWLWDRSICQPPVVRWIEQQRHYVIDRFASEVVEFCRSYELEGQLIRGRLWAELSGWRMEKPTERFEKSTAFQKWFNSLTNWIKRNYVRTPEGWYWGPEASEFQQRCGRFVQADSRAKPPITGLRSHARRS